jgi:predicted DNA-binding transcriptional regulator AlpA
MNATTTLGSNSAKTVFASFSHIPPEALICRKTVEELTGFSATTLLRLLKEGRFPQPVMVGRKRRWYYGDVINWLRSLRSNKEACTNG